MHVLFPVCFAAILMILPDFGISYPKKSMRKKRKKKGQFKNKKGNDQKGNDKFKTKNPVIGLAV